MSAGTMTVRDLEPTALWNHFADLNAVPRASKKEERVIEFARQFGESLGLETIVDEVGNVIIRKPATAGKENCPPVVLQSHLDMVHQKNSDTEFNFDTEGIRMVVEEDWVRAEGTTLGADNGIGVASIMAVLASTDIPHPPLEALFTIDEETGMTGAIGLKGGLLHGKILLNLDTEDDDELTIGCAGGVDVQITGTYESVACPPNHAGYRIVVSGLKGGHSGMDIHLGRGNANRLMNRILVKGAADFGLKTGSIDGGGLRNAIPRESMVVAAVPNEKASAFRSWLEGEIASIQDEYRTTDPELQVEVISTDCPPEVLNEEFQKTMLGVIGACPDGIERMSPEIEGLVQTSNNLARVLIKDNRVEIGCLTRSSVNSERDHLADRIRYLFQLTGIENVEFRGRYPGWKPVPDSMIVKLMSSLYEERFGESAHVAACHAGLECGILGTNYPEMQMISFGPNIRGAHSPDEKVQISSVQKFWGYFLETLNRIE